MDVIVRTGEFSIDYRMLETLEQEIERKRKETVVVFLCLFLFWRICLGFGKYMLTS